MSIPDDLAPVFRRDLARLGQQIEAFPSDEVLWQTVPESDERGGQYGTSKIMPFTLS
jgi:hypothetical protein